MKKAPGDIIILHMCIKSYDQMMYSSWEMVRDGRTDEKSDVEKNIKRKLKTKRKLF